MQYYVALHALYTMKQSMYEAMKHYMSDALCGTPDPAVTGTGLLPILCMGKPSWFTNSTYSLSTIIQMITHQWTTVTDGPQQALLTLLSELHYILII